MPAPICRMTSKASFAESRTNDSVGYALSPTAVAIAIAPGIGRTSAVETGACLR